MKYFIVGLHASGKLEVLSMLAEKYNIQCGNLFSNIDDTSKDIYNQFNYEIYTMLDVNSIFENNAYIMILELLSKGNINSYKYFEGLSKYTFDNNQVFVMSPDQFISIVPNSIKDDICVIWMDNTKNNRISRYRDEKRNYNFYERDEIESKDISAFVKQIYSISNQKVIYFTNEEPCRVATIIYNIIKHPDMLDEFLNNFN